MRVTDSMRDAATRQATGAASERLLSATKKASSGMRVGAPKDDPGAFARIAAKDGGIGVLAARQKALGRADGDLTAAEGALASAADLMARVREIATQMADGSFSAEQRQAAAKEVTQLRQTLVGLANTRGPGGFLFGGTSTGTQPFDAAGTFSGNDAAIEVEVADGMLVRANASGAQAFTAAGGRDLFADLTALATALATDDVAGVQAGLGNVEAGHRQLTRARADAGLTMDRVRSAQAIADSAETTLKQLRAGEGEADALETFTELADAQSAYDRALEVTKRLLSTFQIDKIMP